LNIDTERVVRRGDTVLTIDKVCYRYGSPSSVPALDNISCRLKAGQFSALLGPNGAGKSTLFALLTRLFVPQQGTIYLFDDNLVSAAAKVLANIGVVFQQTTLDLDLTVEQNLLYHGALHGLSTKQIREKLGDELAQFNLQDRLHDKVRQLNGGHRRRLEIVRALLHDPCLLLLDEPTVGLDIESRHYLNEKVRKLCDQRNLCVLWATHLLEEIIEGDDVIIIHRGEVKVQDNSQNLCAQAAVTDLVAAFHHFTKGHV